MPCEINAYPDRWAPNCSLLKLKRPCWAHVGGSFALMEASRVAAHKALQGRSMAPTSIPVGVNRGGGKKEREA